MAVAKGVWGIDIGQCALKAIRLEMIDGKPTATAFDYVEHTKILSQPDADPDALIREALEKFLSRNQVKNDDVAVGIAGQSGLARFVKLPPVEEKKIAEIVKFEAKQQIPFPLDEVVWDYQKISGGEAVDGFALETEIGLFAMKRDVISRYLGYFNASKLEIHTVQMSPLALVNFATYEILKKGGTASEAGEVPGQHVPEADDETPKGKKRCAVVMDIGTDASNLIITDGAKIIWQRPIPLGGNNFTRALTKELKLTFAKAEHLKRNAAKSPEMASILKAIKPVLTDFVGEVQRSLGYFTNTHRDAHVAYMVGLGSAFKLPGLQKYLGDKLSLEVRKPTKFARLSGETVAADPLFQENLLTFPVAYGLALQGLGQARLATNLLPPEITRDRAIRAKKPFAVAAAAMLLIGTAFLAAGFGSDLRSVSDKRIKDATDKATAAGGAHGTQETKVKGKLDEAQGGLREVKLILAGQDERLNWARFFEVQTATMPRPGDKENSGNLTDADQVALWRGAGDVGVEALKWFEKRMRNGVRIEDAVDDERSENPKNLAMVNVEAVHTRWVTDPAAFLAAADAEVYGDPEKKTGLGTYIADYMKAEEKEADPARNGNLKPVWKGEAGQGAWVVEIRGYTDYDTKAVTGALFLRQALVRNLQNIDKFAKDEGKIGRYIVDVKDPVKGRVSHVFAYSYAWTNADATQNTFKFIQTSALDRILAGSASTSGTGGGSTQPAGTMPAAPGNMPASGGGSGGSGGGSGGSGGGSGGGTTPAAAPTIGPDWKGLTSLSAGSGASSNTGVGNLSGGTTEKKDGPTRKRQEFVVMMLWREPTPSSPAAPIDPAAAAATTPPVGGMSTTPPR